MSSPGSTVVTCAGRRNTSIPALLSLLSLTLLVFQYRTLHKLSVLAPMVTHGTIGQYLRYLAARLDFDTADGLLAAAILVQCGAVVGLEITRGRLGDFLARVFESENQTRWLLFACGVIFARYFFARGGLSWAGDSSHHILTADVASRALAGGMFPFWTNTLGTGSPYLLFYGPLFFYVTAVVDLLVRDIQLSLKLLLGFCHAFSGLGLYAFLRAAGLSRHGAFVGGLAYVLCFWHAQQVIVMGRYPLALFYLLLPWTFGYAERLLRRQQPSLPSVLVGGVLLGALAWTHPVYGAWATALLGLYVLTRLVTDRATRRGLAPVGALVAVGLGAGAYLTVPLWLEMHLTGLSRGFDLTGVPTPTWMHLVVWSNFRSWLYGTEVFSRNWYGGYLGVSAILLGVVAVVGTTRAGVARRSSPSVACAVCLLVVLILVFGGAGLTLVPGVRMMGSGRFLLFAVLFLAALAGAGAEACHQWLPGGRGYALPVLLLVIDLGPTTFQHFYVDDSQVTSETSGLKPRYRRIRAAAQAFLNDGQVPPFRAFWAHGEMNRFLAQSLLNAHTQVPIAHAPRPGELLAVVEFIRPLERYISLQLAEAAREEATVSVTALTDAGLRLLDVRFLVLTRPDGHVFAMELPAHSPVVAAPAVISSGTLNEVAPDADVRSAERRLLASMSREDRQEVVRCLHLISQMGLRPGSDTCARIPLAALQDDRDLGTRPQVEVLRHEVREDEVHLRVRTSAPAFLRLAYAWYPHLEVRVNGEPVEPLETADHFIALEVGEGTHRIEVIARLSRLRRGLLAASAMLVLLAAVVAIRPRVVSRRATLCPDAP